jgi:hypothetical protein
MADELFLWHHMWVQNNFHAARNIGIKLLHCRRLGWNHRGTLLLTHLCYLTGWLPSDVIFWKVFYWSCLNMYLKFSGWSFGFSMIISAHCGESDRHWSDIIYPGRLTYAKGWLHGSNCDRFFHIYVFPSSTMKEVMIWLKAAVTTMSDNMLRCIWGNYMCHTGVCLKVDGGHFETML